MSTKIIVLAAGKGTRMKSAKPKVLHKLGGKALLQHVIDNVSALAPESVITVIGHGADQVQTEIGESVTYVVQNEQNGTGHAVQQVTHLIEDEDDVLIAYGDVPLTPTSTFEKLLSASHGKKIGLLTVVLDNPSGYGRVVRDADQLVSGIVEQKDANEEQLLIKEVNTGMLSINGGLLKRLLGKINNNNAQGEYYLTDVFALAVARDILIETVKAESEWEVAGVNSRQQLAQLERIYQRNKANELMSNGVSLADPNRLDIRGELKTGRDVEIDVNCVFVGKVELEDNVSIGPNCVILDSKIGKGTVIKANTFIESAVVGKLNTLGPYARVRPGTHLQNDVHLGNFVEVKNATIDQGSKVNHLSYVGDADIGKYTNVGAGTITCNYDGANKFRTTLGDEVFIGSNTALVAPVTVGNGATVGAGSVISKDVSDQQLALTRAPQKSVNDWKRPVKEKKQQD